MLLVLLKALSADQISNNLSIGTATIDPPTIDPPTIDPPTIDPHVITLGSIVANLGLSTTIDPPDN